MNKKIKYKPSLTFIKISLVLISPILITDMIILTLSLGFKGLLIGFGLLLLLIIPIVSFKNNSDKFS